MKSWREELSDACKAHALELVIEDIEPGKVIRYDIDQAIHGKRAYYCFPAALPLALAVREIEYVLRVSRLKGRPRRLLVATANDGEFRAVITGTVAPWPTDTALGWTRHGHPDEVFFSALNRHAVAAMAKQIPYGSLMRGNDLVLHVPQHEMGAAIADLQTEIAGRHSGRCLQGHHPLPGAEAALPGSVRHRRRGHDAGHRAVDRAPRPRDARVRPSCGEPWRRCSPGRAVRWADGGLVPRAAAAV